MLRLRGWATLCEIEKQSVYLTSSHHLSSCADGAGKRTPLLISSQNLRSSADGIDINFENLPLNKRNEFIDFVRQISSHLKKEFENISLNDPFISVTIPSDNSKENYNIRRLNSVVDLLIIMGYDYNDTSIPSPVSPLLTEYGPNLSKTLDYYSNNGIDKSKTILALPYYGIMWNTTGTEDKDNINQINYQTSIERRLTLSLIHI